MDRKLYYIEETEQSDPDFVVAESVSDAVDIWKEAIKERDKISGRETDVEEPALVRFVTDTVLGIENYTPHDTGPM